MSTDALILDLSANLAPVKRRSVRREALAFVALGIAELMLVLAFGAMRPDLGHVIASPYMIWKMGGLALLAGVIGTVAVRSFAPPASPRRGLTVALGVAGLLMIGSVFVTSAADSGRSLFDRLSPVQGIVCSAAIVMLALPMMAMLAFLMRRAAPVDPRQSALAAGLAASSCGALIFAFCCRMNDPLYIVVWYSVAVGVVAVAARWLLPRRFCL